MALVDATLFDTKSVVNGTLDYKRRKTGKRAIVVLPARVVALLNKPFVDPSGDGFGNPHGFVLTFKSPLRPLDFSGRRTLKTPGSVLKRSLMN
jgi:hypothetical protein